MRNVGGKISIVIPAYNEEKRIAGTLKKIKSYAKAKKGLAFEIIVVDDGSSDRTQDVVKQCRNVRLIGYGGNRGKGYAVKTGILAAKGDLILFSDADLSTPIEELDKLLFWIKQDYDVAIGSRRLPDSVLKIKQPWHRQFFGNAFGLIVRILALPGIKDSQCGFKLFRSAVAKDVAKRLTIDGFSFDVEMLFITQKKKYKIKETPVLWIDSPDQSKVSIIKHTIPMFSDLLRININNILGKYK